ncbi:MAG: hypothetical protein GC189_02365 [Alphaproteobacteria bacterium]|nr:hypothetical protein [Alphaproteobacteria bacterium]
MNRKLFIAIGAIAVAGAAGWFAPMPAPRLAAATEPGLTPLARAGEDLRLAAPRLARVLGQSSADGNAETEIALAQDAPPPPDISTQFRRDVSAISWTARGAEAWISDPASDTGRRALREGDAYRDGWRVRRIGAQSVLLRKGREERSINLYDPATYPSNAPPPVQAQVLQD